jgi:hypothetical protein
MAKWNLNANSEKVVRSWLFETESYLDQAVRLSDGQTARQALLADPTLDVTTWIRANTQATYTVITVQGSPVLISEPAMVWYIRAKDNAQITPTNRPLPAEIAGWSAILTLWVNQINVALANDPGGTLRDQTSVPITDTTGAALTPMGAGLHLLTQRLIFNDVLGVLMVL